MKMALSFLYFLNGGYDYDFMKNNNNYKKRIIKFYVKNSEFIYLLAKKIKKINHHIPLEIEDIISFSCFKLIKENYWLIEKESPNEIFF